MKRHSMGTSLLLALLIAAGLATAQTTTTPTFESAVTTGIVGFAPSVQTAQLNVLNAGGIFASTTTATSTVAAACPVDLEFHDGQNNVLKSLEVPNVPAGTATSLTLKLADLPAGTTALRVDIRGVVKSNPIVTGPIAAGSTPMIPASFCGFVTTLELFDNSTGVTQTLTSDTRPFGVPAIVPLASSTLGKN